MKLFISYSRDDKQWVYEFARRLSNLRSRHDVWFDQDLHVSQKWWDEILNRIEWCEATIIILTPRYVNSPFCMAELEYALALNKPIMPLRMKDCDIPAILKPIQYFDIEALDMSEILIEIAGALGDVRAELSAGSYPPPAIKPPRPSVPTPQEAVPSDPFELFAAVHQAADQGDLTRADNLAQRLKQIDPHGFGLEIDAYLNEKRLGKAGISAYLNIVSYVEAGKLAEARIAWRVYTRQYGSLNYDPKDYAMMLGEIVVTRNPDPPSPPPAPTFKAGDKRTDAKGIVQVYVPAGKFLMGSTDDDEDADVDEKPQHEVTISHPFWLDLTPVTNASYARFIQADGYSNQAFWTSAGWQWLQSQKRTAPDDYGSNFNDPQQPRVGVSWYEAYAYCQWRGGRLPTEAEWEWTARGKNSLIYPWGNDFDPDKLVYYENSGDKPARVGSKPAGASWCGALDLSGNVWEWTQTIYDQDRFSYPYRVDDGRNTEQGTDARVLRGGSWLDDQDVARAACRGWNYPNFWHNYNGFRVVVGLRPPSSPES